MYTKVAVTALLAGSALATPYPPSLDLNNNNAITKIAHFTPKTPGSGNFMGSVADVQPSKTSPAAAAPALERRERGEKVNNPSLATYNQANTKDGNGSGSDSYTYYKGDGSTNQGWPDKSRWVSFENM